MIEENVRKGERRGKESGEERSSESQVSTRWGHGERFGSSTSATLLRGSSTF